MNYTSKTMFKYRPEIDGLRAIAVLSVVLYHAHINIFDKAIFEGGFIGVDIFFVISGYLITGIIIKHLSLGSFSFIDFYERRARRILPMLYVVLLVSFPFAFYYMLEEQFQQYIRSVISIVFFYSNIFFSLLDSYNTESSLVNPVWHFWSLSLEEQFYIVFPVSLFLAWKIKKCVIAILIVTLTVFSLLISQWMSSHHSDMNFFFLPSRGWELLSGSYLAYLEFTRPRLSNSYPEKFMTGLGISLVVLSIVIFKDTFPHPSFITLMPVFGTLFIIRFSGGDDIFTRLLTSKIMVNVGLMSYSIYLWHQPVFAFTHLHTNRPISVEVSIFLIALIIFLSFFSWKYIERPFRDKQLLSRKSLFIILALSTIFTFGLCVWLVSFTSSGEENLFENNFQNDSTNKAISRVIHHSENKNFIDDKIIINENNILENIDISSDNKKTEANHNEQEKTPGINKIDRNTGRATREERKEMDKNNFTRNIIRGNAIYNGSKCTGKGLEHTCIVGNLSKKPTYALLGDSHALTLSGPFGEVLESMDVSGHVITLNGCPFIHNVGRVSYNKPCAQHVLDVFKKIESDGIRNVVILDRRSAYILGTPFDNEEGGKDDTEPSLYIVEDKQKNKASIESILKLQESTIQQLLDLNVKVYFIFPIPGVGVHVRRELIRVGGLENYNLTTSLDVYLKRNEILFKATKIFRSNNNYTEIYPHETFCNSQSKRCLTNRDEEVYYTDFDHLSVQGGRLLMRDVSNKLFK